ncbi:MAG: hypothetical protein RIC19_04380 [Phaeodactylibacter sp.]|uniref:hypothetical protein n=1 Tax=Phaeodactylibacter sp. TaxID=1940289 RepID=UPI0032ECF3CF
MKPYPLFLLLFTAVLPAFGQDGTPYEARYFVNAKGNSLPYRILFPQGYEDSGQTYPLLLFLHGSGKRGDDNAAQLAYEPQAFSTAFPICVWRASAPGAPSCSIYHDVDFSRCPGQGYTGRGAPALRFAVQ